MTTCTSTRRGSMLALLLLACTPSVPHALGPIDAGPRDAAAREDSAIGDAGDDASTDDASTDDASSDAAPIDAAIPDDAGPPLVIDVGDLLVAGPSGDSLCADRVLARVGGSSHAVTRVLCGSFGGLALTTDTHAAFSTELPGVGGCGSAQSAMLQLTSSARFVVDACSDLDFVQLAPFSGHVFAALLSGSSSCAPLGAAAPVLVDGTLGTMTSPTLCNTDWLAFDHASIAAEPSGTLLVSARIFGPLGAIDRIDPAASLIARLASYPIDDAPSAITVGPDGRIFAGIGGSGAGATCPRSRIAEIDPESGAILQTLCEATHTISALAVSPDGQTLYAADTFTNICSHEGAVFTFDVSPGHFGLTGVVCSPSIFHPDAIAIRL